MSNIEFLTSLVQQLGESVKLWSNIRYVCVGATALFTVLSFFTFWKSGNKIDLLGKAKDELSQIKDREKDIQIAKVKTDSRENIERVKADADKQIASLTTEAAKAKEGIEVAKAQAAQANETAERERLARVQLEARLADRKLSQEEQARLISLLKPFNSTEVDIVIFGDTTEIKSIGFILLDCLRKAGWNVHSATGGGGGNIVKGILVGVRSDADVTISNAARALFSGLQTFGIASGPWDFEKMLISGVLFNSSITSKAPMRIFVGSKP